MSPAVRFVTDPMCSWCWGTTPHFEAAMEALADRVTFDILLGGINVHSTKAVGAYGRERLNVLWDEVTTVTGQFFSHRLPEGTVYNSLLPCLAAEAMRDARGAPPIGYTHRLQQRFFAEGTNVNDLDTLLATGEEFDVPRDTLRPLMDSEAVRQRVRWGFETARQYGTNALPSVLVSPDGADFRLFAGGYVDSARLIEDLETWLAG